MSNPVYISRRRFRGKGINDYAVVNISDDTDKMRLEIPGPQYDAVRNDERGLLRLIQRHLAISGPDENGSYGPAMLLEDAAAMNSPVYYGVAGRSKTLGRFDGKILKEAVAEAKRFEKDDRKRGEVSLKADAAPAAGTGSRSATRNPVPRRNSGLSIR
ncbi:MAG: hypothetical protein ING19_07610 [Azospirillum sp.]|nr:hypothetical protein [Azospirillum sp.]